MYLHLSIEQITRSLFYRLIRWLIVIVLVVVVILHEILDLSILLADLVARRLKLTRTTTTTRLIIWCLVWWLIHSAWFIWVSCGTIRTASSSKAEKWFFFFLFDQLLPFFDSIPCKSKWCTLHDFFRVFSYCAFAHIPDEALDLDTAAHYDQELWHYLHLLYSSPC